MADQVQWTEPREVTERQLREETLPGLRRMFRQFTRYYLLVGPVVAIIYLVFDRSDDFGLLTGLLMLAWFIYMIPLSIWINILQARKSGVRRRVDAKGIRINFNLYRWERVEAYNLSGYPILPNVGSLNVKLRGRQQWTSLPFPRNEVSEKELHTLMERFAPPPAPSTV